jgi:mRNA-degrading endonuclease RelE of RelBE toxin-antitoxin system
MLARKAEPTPIAAPHIEHFSMTLPLVRQTPELRLDASFYNPRVAEALAVLRRSELDIRPLAEVTKRIFIPPRFKRIYVDQEHGVPFLQGSHVVHFQPADIKYLSRAAHTRLDRWIIEAGWDPGKVRAQIVKKARALLTDPFPPGCKKLVGVTSGTDAVWRVRSGDYRILYVARPNEVIVIDIGDRKDIYR